MSKIITIIANDSLIYQEINNNLLNYNTELYDYELVYFDNQNNHIQQIISNLDHINLLLVASEVFDQQLPLFKINQIITINNTFSDSLNAVDNIIKLTKPLKLVYLINLIIKTLEDQMLFCKVNKELIYHQRISSLITQDQELIYFTNKENKIFKALLLSHNHSVTKDELRRDIWQYHENTRSTTFDTHIYNLKQKLPKGLLEIQSEHLLLRI